MADNDIHVDVAYATPAKQWIIPVRLKPGASIYDAVVQSGVASKAGVDLASVTLGVFGKVERNPKERIAQEGERVEIYRPLIADPKEARKKRAASKADDAE